MKEILLDILGVIFFTLLGLFTFAGALAIAALSVWCIRAILSDFWKWIRSFKKAGR